jgi:acetylornithine deacetylase/succinyl-diaminopimelate desuccinylase family protein
MASSDDFRLSEQHRSWNDPNPSMPPPAETQAQLASRWDALSDERQRICDEVDRRRDEYIELLRDLVHIPSVNPSLDAERPLATFVAEKMRELGMEVRQMEPAPNRVSNLARLPGTGADSLMHSLLYYAHLDTVPAGDEGNWRFPPFSATVSDGRIYGRGAKDCKLGMAAALASTSAIRDAGISLGGDLSIVTPADEETGGHLGIAAMLDAGWLDGIEACIYGEGVPERLTIGANGGVQFRVTTRGKSAHTAWKQLGTNAILHAGAVAQAIDQMEFPDCQPHPIVPGQPVASVNLISGGFKLNVVPDRCDLDVDLRFPPGYTAERALARVHDAIEGVRADERFATLQADVHVLSLMRPYAVNPDQPVVRALGMCVADVRGEQSNAIGMPASSDARWLYLDGHIPTVNYSFGNDSGHLPNEYVDIDGYIANIKVYALASLLLLA